MTLRLARPEGPPAPARVESPPVLCIASGKGGVGKTSLSLCLAREVARTTRVLVIDLDYFNRGATGLLCDQVEPWVEGFSLVEVLPLYGDEPPELEPVAAPPPIRLDRVRQPESLILCPCPELAQPILRGVHDQPVDELAASLRFLVAWLCRAHDVGCVVIDAHGGPDPLSFAACEVADDVVLVTEPDRVTLHGTLNFLAGLQDTPARTGRGRMHLVFNRVSANFGWADLERTYDRDLKDLFDGRPLLGAVPFDDEIFDHFGSTPFITSLFPRSLFAQKVGSIARRLLLERHPELVPRAVRRWSSRRARRVHRTLARWSLARPLPIAVMWLVALIALVLTTSIVVLNPSGYGRWYELAWNASTLTALGAGGLALACSLALAARTAARHVRFARYTPFQRLYTVKAALNVVLLVAASVGVLAGGAALSSKVADVVGYNRMMEGRRKEQCRENLAAIGRALEAYRRGHDGAWPPASSVDRAGRPLLSWRVLILPELGRDDLYRQFRLDEPWDSAANQRAAATMPGVYACPSDPEPGRVWTDYVAVVGPGSCIRPPADRPGEPTASAQPGADSSRDPTPPAPVAQARSVQPIAVAEVVGLQIPWSKPGDLDDTGASFLINDPKGISSKHPGGAFVLHENGEVAFLSETISETNLVRPGAPNASDGDPLSRWTHGLIPSNPKLYPPANPRATPSAVPEPAGDEDVPTPDDLRRDASPGYQGGRPDLVPDGSLFNLPDQVGSDRLIKQSGDAPNAGSSSGGEQAPQRQAQQQGGRQQMQRQGGQQQGGQQRQQRQQRQGGQQGQQSVPLP